MTYFPPEPLTSQHLPTDSDCGKSQLNRWLIQHALANEMTGRSRTFVVREDSDMRTVGFYCLSTAIVAYGDATTRAAADLPVDQPIPAVLLGRLAVDSKHQHQGLGKGLLADAVRRTFEGVGRNAGVRVMLVHAKDRAAAHFDEHWGFESSPTNDLHLMLLAQDVERLLGP